MAICVPVLAPRLFRVPARLKSSLLNCRRTRRSFANRTVPVSGDGSEHSDCARKQLRRNFRGTDRRRLPAGFGDRVMFSAPQHMGRKLCTLPYTHGFNLVPCPIRMTARISHLRRSHRTHLGSYFGTIWSVDYGQARGSDVTRLRFVLLSARRRRFTSREYGFWARAAPIHGRTRVGL